MNKSILILMVLSGLNFGGSYAIEIDFGSPFLFISRKNLALMDAAREGDLKEIRKCIRKGGNPAWHSGTDPKFNLDTPLTAAVTSNSVYAVQVLLANGAAQSINWVINGNKSALDLAVIQGNIEIARALLNRKAEIKGNGLWNNTRDALMLAIDSGNLKMVELLLKYNPVVEEAYVAAAKEKKYENIVAVLLIYQSK